MTEKALIGSNEEYIIACCKSPAELTDRDLAIIESSHPKIAVERRAERAKALAKQADTARIRAQQSATAAGAIASRERSLMDSIASGTAAVLKELFTPRDTRLEAPERRCADLEFQTTQSATRLKSLEARPELRYCGIFREGQRYSTGALITRSGPLWFAEEDTDCAPGETASGWRLV